jgi:hypothetical protein
MFWIALALLLVVGALLARGRKQRYEAVAEEPWRASLQDEDDEIDEDELRRAEQELLHEGEEEDEPWR